MPQPEEFRYPCEQCGALLRFAPGQTHLRCGHCGHEQDIPEAAAEKRDKALEELDLREALAHHLPAAEMEETRVLSCPACGAQVEFEPHLHSAECPFCATPVVTDTGVHRHIKPSAVIPFRLTEQEAHDAMSGWLRSLWFAPNGLGDYARKGRRLNGIYVPFWTFDADTQTSYSGMRGDVYYTGSGKDRKRRIRWTPVSGRLTRFFDDVLVVASTSLPLRYTENLEPWDLRGLAPYNPDFLAGFRAEGYTVELPAGFARARERMDAVIAGDVRSAIGGSQQRVSHVSTTTSDETFKHVLLPIWMAAYRYRGKSFRFVVNGQTGKVRGERPWSAWKIAFAVLLALVLAGIIALVSQ